MEHYKGFIIFGGASRDDQSGCSLYGLVCMRGPRTLLEIKCIEATHFQATETAEQHGIELCKLWIAEHGSEVEVGPIQWLTPATGKSLTANDPIVGAEMSFRQDSLHPLID